MKHYRLSLPLKLLVTLGALLLSWQSEASCWRALVDNLSFQFTRYVRVAGTKADGIRVPLSTHVETNEVLAHYASIDPFLRDNAYLDSLGAEEVHNVFMKLINENIDFQRFVEKTVWPATIKDRPINNMSILVERSILSLFNRTKPGIVIKERSAAIEKLTRIAKHSEEFKLWFSEQEKYPAWKEHEADFAADILQRWEAETRKRNTPRSAALGSF